MFAQSPPEEKTKSPFGQFCEAAINKDPVELAITRLIAFIDVHEHGHTPVSILAAKGDFESVDFLLQQGASYAWAAYGFALSKNTEIHSHAYNLLQKIKIDHPNQIELMLTYIIYGLAKGGHKEEAYAFLAMIEKEYPDSFTFALYCIGEGFAQGGYDTEALKILEIGKKHAVYNLILKAVSAGIAEREDKTDIFTWLKKIEEMHLEKINARKNKMKLLFNEEKYQEYESEYLNSLENEHASQVRIVWGRAAYGLARQKDNSGIYQLLDQANTKHPSIVDTLLTEIASGLGALGNEIYIATFLKEVKDKYPTSIPDILSRIACGLALSGHKKKANFFLNNVEQDYPELKIIPILSSLAKGIALHHHYLDTYHQKKEIFEFLDTVHRSYPNGFLVVLEKIIFSFSKTDHEIQTILDKVELSYPTHLLTVLVSISYELSENETKLNAFLIKINTHYPTYVMKLLSYFFIHLIIGIKSVDPYVFLKKLKNEYSLEDFTNVLIFTAKWLVERNAKNLAYALLSQIQKDHPEQTQAILKTIARAEHVKGESVDIALVLKTLTLLDSSVARKTLAEELKETITAYNPQSLLATAETFGRVLKWQNITYNELEMLIKPGNMIVLLLTLQLAQQKNLSSDLFQCIAAFLTPKNSPSLRLYDLSHKFMLIECPQRFFKTWTPDIKIKKLCQLVLEEKRTQVKLS